MEKAETATRPPLVEEELLYWTCTEDVKGEERKGTTRDERGKSRVS